MTELDSLEQALRLSFRDRSLLEQALTHSSYRHEHPEAGALDNERLEFLGDAFLGLAVARELYARFPDHAEGQLSRLRSALVCQESLARWATALNLGRYLRLGKGEVVSGGRHRERNLASTLEALLGAVLLDQGERTALALVRSWLEGELPRAWEQGIAGDFKSRLQEQAQALGRGKPSYQVVQTAGPEHARRYEVEVFLGEELVGRGRGKSRRQAEMEAARQALASLELEAGRA